LLKLLRDTIAVDRYPLSRRIRTLKSVLAKLDPQPRSSSPCSRREYGSTPPSGSGRAEVDVSDHLACPPLRDFGLKLFDHPRRIGVGASLVRAAFRKETGCRFGEGHRQMMAG